MQTDSLVGRRQRSCSRTIAQGKGRSRSLRNEHATRSPGTAHRIVGICCFSAEVLQNSRSEVRYEDILDPSMWQRYGSTFLFSHHAARPPGRGLWTFSGSCSLPAAVGSAEGKGLHTVSDVTRRSVSRNRSGRHGLERTPSPASSRVRLPHRT